MSCLSHSHVRIVGLVLFAAVTLVQSSGSAPAVGAEVARLHADNWKEFAPRGKEVDCIEGDFVLRNDRIVAVVAQPRADRNANMTVRGVGGCLIDLTRRLPQSDQLSAYYPGGGKYAFHSAELMGIEIDGQPAAGKLDSNAGTGSSAGERVSIWFRSEAAAGKATAELRYTLDEKQDWLTIELKLTNPHEQPIDEDLADSIRADRTFEFGDDSATGMFWAYDEWFRQAYGVIVDGRTIQRGGSRGAVLSLMADGKSKTTIPPGESITIRSHIFPGRDLLHLKSIAGRMAKIKASQVAVTVVDPAGAVANAKVTVKRGEESLGSGRTSVNGKLSFRLPEAEYTLQVEALGRPTTTPTIAVTGEKNEIELRVEACGYVAAEITDEQGGPIPCKVAFHGKDGTESPFFGPDSAAVGVHNLHYSHDGKFRQEIGPGRYDVIVSRGPEYDAVFTEIEVRRGEETKLAAKLVRTVQTPGWISSDFHSHSTPSGDNVSSQRGRVLNLLCEQIEFGPCTEHNRITTYRPHLKALEAERWMATCTGMELTGSPLPVNHQNAFPLIMKPRQQDGGAPVTDANPIVQIERLALWDNNSDKLVQGNHPNLRQIIGDRDLNGEPDGGFERMFRFMDVVEVHPPQTILLAPGTESFEKTERNPIFQWLQMLNLGYRITGVVNTDAHYNFHESGWLRNYLKSSTDDPAEIKTMEMVHAAEDGHVVMTNGPYLRVELTAAEPSAQKRKESATSTESGAITAGPGDDIGLPGGKATLRVHVACANWINVNRVQVLLNGKLVPELNFTRRMHPDRFSDDVIKFDSDVQLELKSDTHVIVAAAGEGLKLGPVMGPKWGEEMPIAVSNPIFVDVDGSGFKPNGDLLGVPLPIAPDQKLNLHRHGHDHDHEHGDDHKHDDTD